MNYKDSVQLRYPYTRFVSFKTINFDIYDDQVKFVTLFLSDMWIETQLMLRWGKWKFFLL